MFSLTLLAKGGLNRKLRRAHKPRLKTYAYVTKKSQFQGNYIISKSWSCMWEYNFIRRTEIE